MKTDDINVFGSLRNFIADQSMQAVERDRQKLEAIQAAKEQFMPTPAQSAYIGTIFAPGSGVVDASGAFPEFPSADVPVSEYLSGEPMPSMAENIAAGGIDRYLFAPLQGLGVVGDAMYAAPVVGPVLGATIGTGLKGIGALGPVLKAAAKSDKKGIKALRNKQIQEDVNTFARDSEGFVSPSLEALISKAPANLKGKQITEWLSANANKGVKPKELEFLGVDEFIANNPNASVREVAEGVSQNKVEVGKNVYYHGGDAPEIDFEVTTPELDPLDPSYKNYQPLIEDISYDIEQGDIYYTEQLIDAFNTSNPQAGAKTISDVDNYLSARNESLDDLIDSFAKGQYYNDPYELVVPKSTNPAYDASIPDETFAFGNEETGYDLFIGGERVKVADNEIPYSRTEAQIQLRNALEEGGDPLRLPGEEDFFTETRYKGDVDESLPGGNNYREIVYTWKNAPVEHDVQDHFEELNQISHALVRDRKLADGSFSLHVDELQSDLHTKGKKDGYSTPELDMDDTIILGKMSSGISTEFTKLKNRILPKLENSGLDTNRLENIKTQIANAEELYARSPQDRFSLIRMNDARREMYDTLNSFSEFEAVKNLGPIKVGKIEITVEDFDAFKPFDEALRPALEIAQAQSARVPNYPFKGDDWYKMSLKQLLKDAIEEGKDTISVSGSYAIKDRYTDRYEKFYESLYDQKIPSEMKKLANKYGGKFEKGKLDIDDTFGAGTEKFLPQPEIGLDRRRNLVEANIIRITPEMKQKILEEGLSSFALGGPVGNFIAPDDINIFA
jgi:hypothetical protein